MKDYNGNWRKQQSLLIGKVFKLIKSATYKNFVYQNKLFHGKIQIICHIKSFLCKFFLIYFISWEQFRF